MEINLHAAAGLLALALLRAHPAGAAPAIGQPTPALVVRQIDAATFDLAALRGKVVVVNFWATWCPPCRDEMPVLDRFYREYHDRGVELIGVSIDRPRDIGDVKKVMKAYAYRAALISAARENGFGDPEALPVTYVIDATGVVRGKWRADGTPVTADSIKALVLPLLSSDAGS